ncbi:DUF1659 domain-containing protein [Clostridium paridis]|uniref:DUF1659 domain-containing protein n=1 Tax=Clostridium paridis TaxID=2803863 RepID=A0A937FBQ4_9CLOT|nr:DUF1659 domain-containing protein [Clostridium paridis]MBL4930368.1 DUF1659 domain-containing protein [Clostridium paridis]
MTEAILSSLSLVIKYKAGIDKEGHDVFKRQAFLNISDNASDDDLSIVGHEIGELLNTQIYSILKENRFELLG